MKMRGVEFAGKRGRIFFDAAEVRSGDEARRAVDRGRIEAVSGLVRHEIGFGLRHKIP
ncbi:MAG: hypothetical protein R3C55_15910 [Parvularculaceae bacterium]